MAKFFKLISALLVVLVSCSSCAPANQVCGDDCPCKLEASSNEETESSKPYGIWEEITQNREKVFDFLEENPDPINLIENPSSSKMSEFTYSDADIPDAVYEFLYIYYGSLVSLEIPDFSSLEANNCYFGNVEEMMRFHVARERLQSSYYKDLSLEVILDEESISEWIIYCTVKWNVPGEYTSGTERWKFEVSQNYETGRLEIDLWEYIQSGHGGLYPGLENIFTEIKARFPEYKNDDKMLADAGIAEILLGIVY